MGSEGIIESKSTEELWVEFCQSGRQEPFEEIVRRYAGMVYSVCLRVTKCRHDAEDATQAVFLTLAVQGKLNRPIKVVGPWLRQVAKRVSIDLHRSRKRRRQREEKHGAMNHSIRSNLDSAGSMDQQELRHLLTEELNQLSARYRLPLILHYFGGLSRDEIARELKCKPSTLGVRIYRGQKLLAGRLSRRGVMMGVGGLAGAMVYAVQSAVSDTLAASTALGAARLAAGQEAGVISAQVVGLSRGALNAVSLAKLKVAMVLLLLGGTALSATAGIVAKAGSLDWQFKSPAEQVRPMLRSLLGPLLSDARPVEREIDDDQEVVVQSIKINRELIAMPQGITSGLKTPIPNRVGRDVDDLSAHQKPTASQPWASEKRLLNDRPSWIQTKQVGKTISPNLYSVETPRAQTNSESSWKPRGFMNAGFDKEGFSGIRPFTQAAERDKTTVVLGTPSSFPPNSIVFNSGAHSAIGSHAITTSNDGLLTAAPGRVRGWGKVASANSFDQNGKVIADGYGSDHTLDFSAISRITNSIDNPAANGTNGWFAQNHGKLVLAPIHITAGNGSYMWGEAADDSSPDLVNSVRVTIHNAAVGGELGISLLSLDHGEVPALPSGHTFIGVWGFDLGDIPHAGIDLTVRYDDGLAAALGLNESNMKLWAYDGGWHRIDNSLDTANHLITGRADSLTRFAVSTPEPACLGLVVIGGSLLLFRPRRREN